MKFSLVLSLCVIVIAILPESTCHAEGRPMQSSLFYGRRSSRSLPHSFVYGRRYGGPLHPSLLLRRGSGFHYNLNNRFRFGKRTPSGFEPMDSLNQVKHACKMLMGYIDSLQTTSAS